MIRKSVAGSVKKIMLMQNPLALDCLGERRARGADEH